MPPFRERSGIHVLSVTCIWCTHSIAAQCTCTRTRCGSTVAVLLQYSCGSTVAVQLWQYCCSTVAVQLWQYCCSTAVAVLLQYSCCSTYMAVLLQYSCGSTVAVQLWQSMQQQKNTLCTVPARSLHNEHPVHYTYFVNQYTIHLLTSALYKKMSHACFILIDWSWILNMTTVKGIVFHLEKAI